MTSGSADSAGSDAEPLPEGRAERAGRAEAESTCDSADAPVTEGGRDCRDVMRVLQHGGNPTQLGIALAHFGRIFKTLYVLSYVDAEPYRRDIKRMRNLQEERQGVLHAFHGSKGELREAYHAGMEDQLGTLGLVTGCVTL